ncbi:MAG: oxidative damage protection protein [Legionella sp.]|nr:oxidative damage protection protein [Legionella sp.]
MSRMVRCCKLNEELEGLVKPPFPGPLGARVYNEVSKQAWSMWLSHQTMLINEYRLNLMEPRSREFLKEELEKYFFGEGSAAPSGFIPNQS